MCGVACILRERVCVCVCVFLCIEQVATAAVVRNNTKTAIIINIKSYKGKRQAMNVPGNGNKNEKERRKSAVNQTWHGEKKYLAASWAHAFAKKVGEQ